MEELLNQQLWYLLLFLGSILLNIVLVLVLWGLYRQRLYLQHRLPFVLRDHYEDSEGSVLSSVTGEVTIDQHSNWLEIRVDGYGEHDAADNCGHVVFMEYYDSELRLYYTDDINDIGQPTKVVLEGARLSNRIESNEAD